MSWVSILEDAMERFEAALHLMEKEFPEDKKQITKEQYDGAHALLDRCRLLLVEVRKHLDIATDPNIELAAELSEAQRELSSLKTEIHQFKKTCSSLRRELDKERSRAEHATVEMKKLRGERNHLERELDQVMRENPGAVYDAFSKGIERKTNKP